MGMFNTVLHECPMCGNHIENQTKSGSQTLAEFDEFAVPPEEVEGLDTEVFCHCCESSFDVVRITPPQMVSFKLIPQG